MKKETILVFKGDTYLEQHGKPLRVRRITHDQDFQVEERLPEDPELVWKLNPLFFVSYAEVWLAAWAPLQAKHGEKFMREFWSIYARESTSKNRAMVMKKLDPLRGTENVEFWARSLDGRKQRGQQDALADYWNDSLADWLRDCIISKNPAPLRALADSLGKQKNADKRGVPNEKWIATHLDDMEQKQRLLHCFCRLLQEKRAIPTRLELEAEAGIIRQVRAGKASDTSLAGHLRKLGLDYLPE